MVLGLLLLSLPAWSQTIYVNAEAGGANNGSSWTDAFTDLQLALAQAQSGDEIWVAVGTYLPTSDETDRDATFQLKNGVALYGGFAGSEEELGQRDWQDNPTILSGDINDSTDLDGNSYTVVTGSGTDSTAILDGFTVTGGNADDDSAFFIAPARSGGGAYNNHGAPTLANIIFTNNSADNLGGAMLSSSNSSPTLTNVTFSNNVADRGGGMYNIDSSPSLSNVIFSNNVADRGGAIYNTTNSSPSFNNVTFGNNTAQFGGGMFNTTNSSPTLTNATFSNNTADSTGGGMYNQIDSAPSLTNVTFSHNTAGFSGGMFNNIDCNPTLINTLVAGNTANLNFPDIFGEVNSDSRHNLIGDDTGLGGISDGSNGNQIGSESNPIDALLAPLADNDGFTLTLALLPGSPAIGAGDNEACADEDQRGIKRPQGEACDIGAFESRGFLLARESGDGQATLARTDFAEPLIVNIASGSGEPVDGGQVDFTAPDAGASLSNEINLVSIIDGQASLTATTNAVAGQYVVIARTVGSNDTADFNLENIASFTVGGSLSGLAVGNSVDLQIQTDGPDENLTLDSDGDFTFSAVLDDGGNYNVIVQTQPSDQFCTVANGQGQIETEDVTDVKVTCTQCPSKGGIIHVNAEVNAAGDGSSWTDAYANLQDALGLSEGCGLNSVSIWVAQGNYYPDQGIGQTKDDRNATFQLRNNVALYGGFVGTEKQRDQRNWRVYETRLSGDINNSGTLSGNSYAVVTASETDDTAVLDGFTVTGGNADGDFPHNTGAGIFNVNGSPVLSNLLVSDNFAGSSGGGMYNNLSSPTLTNVTFRGNQVSFSGGGMRNLNSNPTLINAIFSGNLADMNGGGMENLGSSPALINVTFTGNRATAGGALISQSNSNPVIRNSIFWNNRDATGTGTTRASISNATNSKPSFSFSLIQGCYPGGAWENDCGTDAGNNLEDTNPLFIIPVDPETAPSDVGNFRLQRGSPAIDAGNNDFVDGVDTDLDGNPRIMGSDVDLGPFEAEWIFQDRFESSLNVGQVD
ncbi:MAG: hypothetical protein EA370_04750 [Wenzhouxiangella sp.]|nr:MAG: hypothetical protein EA370_04750 [Wenzhouxiangella sp.]